MKFISGFG